MSRLWNSSICRSAVGSYGHLCDMGGNRIAGLQQALVQRSLLSGLTPDGSIEAVRTPEDCFANIEDFPYEPQYVKNVVGGLRMAYYDVPADNDDDDTPTFVCIHGEPTWSYLYRHMIPTFQQRGRVVCLDLLGFGRSDKPIHREDYTYSLHRTAILAAIRKLKLRNITLVVQDWGGILGLTLPLESPSLYSRLVVMNTLLPLEPGSYQTYLEVQKAKEQGSAGNSRSGFAHWYAHSQKDKNDMNVGRILFNATGKKMDDATVAAYDAPYPSPEHKMGAITFPTLVPLSAHQPQNDGYIIGRQAIDFYRYHWGNRPIFMAIGAQDPVIPPPAMMLMRHALTNDGQNKVCSEPLMLDDAGHFVQEQRGQMVAEKAIEYFDQFESA